MFKKYFIITFIIFSQKLIFSQNIMTYEEYSKIIHTIPYKYQLSKSNQKFFYFGANHSCDPKNEQYLLLKFFWQEFLDQTNGKNCVVLIEGSLRNLHESKTPEEAIRRAGAEGGFITFFSHKANINIECPEPNEQFLINELKKEFSEEEIAYKNFAQATLQYNRCKIINPNSIFIDFIQPYFIEDQRNFRINLTNENMQQIHQKLFNTNFDPNDEKFFYTITNPVIHNTVINKICRKASIIRDSYIVNYINNLIKQGKNIFIVYGATHAVMQENAIRNVWYQNE